MLRRKDIRVVSITERADDSPTGKLMEAIIESVDEFYLENLAQEVKRGCGMPRPGATFWPLARLSASLPWCPGRPLTWCNRGCTNGHPRCSGPRGCAASTCLAVSCAAGCAASPTPPVGKSGQFAYCVCARACSR